MKLSTKTTVWVFSILLVVLINSLLTLFTVKELQLTDRITAEDYQVSNTIRRLRDGVVDFYVYGLLAGRKESTFKERQKFTESKNKLIEMLDSQLEDIHQPDIEKSLVSIKQEIQSLLKFRSNLNSVNSKPNSISLLNPLFRKKFETNLEDLDVLAEQSSQIVSVDRNRNETLAQHLIYAAIAMFTLALTISIGMIILLRKSVLLPIQTLIDTVKQVQNGDFSLRCPVNRQDEIGTMCQSFNNMVSELEYRRTERIRLIGSIAHDLKNPLSALGLSCELFLNKGNDFPKEEAFGLVKKIYSQIDRLKRMIEDLLKAASAITPGFDLKLSHFDLLKVANETIELFRDSYPNRKYRLFSAANLPEILADQDRIVQVLTNLLSNAIKYSPEGSEIELALNKELDNTISIEIRDRGIGIPENKLESIFQPFTRLDKARTMGPGLGLGLATVKGIIVAHSGHISAIRRVGGGMIFRIELPVEASQIYTSEEKLRSFKKSIHKNSRSA